MVKTRGRAKYGTLEVKADKVDENNKRLPKAESK